MSRPTIHGKRPVYSASAALASVGDALQQIKHEDGLTWADMGAVLGKSDDQAAKYAEGSAEMSLTTFGRAYREWNGRFAGAFLDLCRESRPAGGNDHASLTTVLNAAAVLSRMLEDGQIHPEEVRAHRRELEAAKEAIEAQLAKLVAAA